MNGKNESINRQVSSQFVSLCMQREDQRQNLNESSTTMPEEHPLLHVQPYMHARHNLLGPSDSSRNCIGFVVASSDNVR